MKLTNNQLATWKRDGIIIVPNVFSEEAVSSALEAVEQNAYDGLTYKEYRAKWDEKPDALKSAYEKNDPMNRLAGPFAKVSHFPTGLAPVDKLIENETYTAIAKQLLDTDEIRISYGQIFLREGLTDSRYSEHPWQGYHIDNGTNSALPPHPDWLRYGYILCSIMLHDVDLDGAPMLICPGSQDQLDIIWEKHPGSAGGLGIPDLREFKELAKPVPLIAKAGSAVYRSSYIVHAAQPFANRSKQRVWMGYHFHRADNADWCNTTRPIPRSSPHYMNFITQTTPTVRNVLGWPTTGDPYYTPQALDRMAQAFPGIDLEPYRKSL